MEAGLCAEVARRGAAEFDRFPHGTRPWFSGLQKRSVDRVPRSSSTMSLGPATPWRVGLHHSLSPLYRPIPTLHRSGEAADCHLAGAVPNRPWPQLLTPILPVPPRHFNVEFSRRENARNQTDCPFLRYDDN